MKLKPKLLDPLDQFPTYWKCSDTWLTAHLNQLYTSAPTLVGQMQNEHINMELSCELFGICSAKKAIRQSLVHNLLGRLAGMQVGFSHHEANVVIFFSPDSCS